VVETGGTASGTTFSGGTVVINGGTAVLESGSLASGIVAFTGGGGTLGTTDIVGRALAQALSQRMNASFIVEAKADLHRLEMTAPKPGTKNKSPRLIHSGTVVECIKKVMAKREPDRVLYSTTVPLEAGFNKAAPFRSRRRKRNGSGRSSFGTSATAA
jgi:hypothetical protein